MEITKFDKEFFYQLISFFFIDDYFELTPP